MSRSIYDLTVLLQTSLATHIPGIVTLLNAAYATETPVPAPVTYERWVRQDILARLPARLPALVCAIYSRDREQPNGPDIQEDAARVLFPYLIQVGLAADSEEQAGDFAAKWADILDYYVQHHVKRTLAKGVTAEDAPSLDVSTSASNPAGKWLVLVQASGLLKTIR